MPIPELFSLGSLVKAPEAYHRFCQMHTVVPDDRNMLRNRLPQGTAQQAFAGQLFRIIRCGHRRLGATFHRNGNSNLTLAYVTPTGALLDLYFLTSSQEIGSVQVLRECQQNDLFSAFEMLCTLAYEVSQTLAEMLLEALTTYAYPAAVPEDLKMLAKETAAAIIQAQARLYHRSSSPLKALVNVTLASYPPLSDTEP